MITKTISEIREDILSSLKSKLPTLDLTEGTPERDIFVEAPIAGQLINLWNKIIYAAKLHAPILYYQDLDEADVNNYCANYNVLPVPASYSNGIVTFYAYNMPSADIYINEGQIVTTLDSPPIEFTVDGTYTIYKNALSNYYNPIYSRYEINCAVTSRKPGASFRAVSGAVTKIVGSISGIEGCVNRDLIGGGANTDTVQNRLTRVIEKFQGRNMASTLGLMTYVRNLAQSVNIIGARDPEMLRDGGLGGCIDIYIRGDNLVTTTDTLTITSVTDSTSSPIVTSTGIQLAYQPVHTIQSLVVNNAIQPTTYYTLSKDTGILARSTNSFDSVTLTSTGRLATGGFKIDDVIDITYNYNGLLHTINNNLIDSQNHYMNRDYLVREMTPVTINFYARIKESIGYPFATVISTVQLGADDVISAISNNENVELADIIGGIKNLPGVDNIDLTTVSIINIGGGTKTAQGDIILGRNEYPVTGTVTVIQWI